jgi:hypothetical protein
MKYLFAPFGTPATTLVGKNAARPQPFIFCRSQSNAFKWNKFDFLSLSVSHFLRFAAAPSGASTEAAWHNNCFSPASVDSLPCCTSEALAEKAVADDDQEGITCTGVLSTQASTEQAVG